MKEILRHYAEELSIFNGYTRQFAQRYPETASALHIAGDSCSDPQAASVIQSTALLTARVKRLIDSNFPQFTAPMLEALYPHYLRPIPAHTIVQFDVGGTQHAELRSTLARGTPLTAPPMSDVKCEFITAYDVKLAPVVITTMKFSPHISAPTGTCLTPGVNAGISVVIESTARTLGLSEINLPTLRVFVDGEPSLRAALIDTLFMRTRDAFVQDDSAPHWHRLRSTPLRHVGFADDEAMLPFCARSRQAFRVLTEYFAYPDKFNFIDIDLAALVAALPAGCKRCTLHLGVAMLSKDADAANLLGELSSKHLLLNCTPVINLFKRPGVPIQLDHTTPDYPVLADTTHAAGYEVHTIDAVRVMRAAHGKLTSTPFLPLYARSFDGQATDKGNYYLTRRSETLDSVSPGHELRIALIDPAFTTADTDSPTLGTDLHCTNRDVPSTLGYGHRMTDFACNGFPHEARVRVLRKPSASYRFATAGDSLWRLIAHLTLDHNALNHAGLDDFHKMLTLYQPPGSTTAHRFIQGIVALEHGFVRSWLRTIPRSTLMPGVRIRMTIDEDAFAGRSIYLFAQVMDQYFSANAQQNCYIELELISLQTGEPLILCPPHTAEPLRPSSSGC
jgi:type VI secretion system protein ImpG